MVGLTRTLARHPCLEQIQASLDSLIHPTSYNGLHSMYRSLAQLSGFMSFSTKTDVELQTTQTCLDFLRQETKLRDLELIKIVSSVETIGFNSAGQV